MNLRFLWLGSLLVSAGIFALVAVTDPPAPSEPLALFWFTVIATAGCAVFALALVFVGRRVAQPELIVLGSGLFAASILPFVHGLTVPGVLWSEPTGTFMFAAWFGVPAGLLVAAPALFTGWSGRAWFLRRATSYSSIALTAATLAAIWLLVRPNSVPVPRPDAWWTIVGSSIAIAGSMMLAARQIELFEVGRRKASLAAALGFSWLGASSLIWFISGPNDAVVWLAHLLDASGVLAAAAGLVLGHRSNRAVTTVLAPILNRDPAVALRLGITPQIESFVARIETKDVSTAGHVTRVAELAMRLGERGGIGGDRLRTIGLAALLHDIGKIRVPTEILTKPDKLTDEEFAIIKCHPEWGQEILDSDSLLAPVGRLVRGHHERVDGRGYPDGLSGDAVTLDMGLVAVTDSWDAMVQNRHYRAGMSHDQARAIFVEHAGAQWPTRAVELLLEHLDEEGQLDAVFADLLTESDGHVCDDALAGLPV